MAQSPSLLKLSDDFVRWLAAYRGYSPHTANNYALTLEQFRAFLRRRDGLTDAAPLVLSLFTDEAVQAFAMDLAGRGVHQNTIVNKLAGLSSFARYLMQRKGEGRATPYLLTNPTKAFLWPTLEEPDTPFLHPDELGAFLAVEIPMRESAARAVLFDTAIRVSEACRTDVGDLVEIDGGYSIAVTVKGRGTRRRKLHVPLSESTVRVLRGCLTDRELPTEDRAHDAAQPLLVDVRGRRFTSASLYALIRRIGEAAGIARFPVGPHTLRHTKNVVRRVGGIDAYQRSKMLGQSDPRSQERYNHLVPGEMRQAKAKEEDGLAKYLSQPKGSD